MDLISRNPLQPCVMKHPFYLRIWSVQSCSFDAPKYVWDQNGGYFRSQINRSCGAVASAAAVARVLSGACMHRTLDSRNEGIAMPYLERNASFRFYYEIDEWADPWLENRCPATQYMFLRHLYASNDAQRNTWPTSIQRSRLAEKQAYDRCGATGACARSAGCKAVNCC